MNSDTSIGQILVELEVYSKRHLGRKCRLPVAAVIASSDVHSAFWARQVAHAVDIGENQAAAELSEFETLGALEAVPSTYDRRRVYQKVEHHFWDFARATVEEVVEARHPGGSADFWATLSSRSDPERLRENGG